MGWLKDAIKKGKKLYARTKERIPRLTKKVLGKMSTKQLKAVRAKIDAELERREAK